MDQLMKQSLTALLIIAMILVIAACERIKKTEAPNPVDEAKTREVLDHHWNAFQANDMEATMADYTEESILITPDAIYKGLAEIRQNFEQAFAAFPKDSTQMQLNKTVVILDVGYILWQATTPQFELTYATDSFIIRDGKIIRQTYAGAVK
jgi:hypothetical protein